MPTTYFLLIHKVKCYGESMRTGRPRSVSDEAIFDAVRAVVTEVGPSGLTLAAIADRVGLSAPALTQRFGSKRSLLLAYAEAAATGIDELISAGLNRLPSAIHTAYNGALVTWGMTGAGSAAEHVRTQLTLLLHPYLAPAPLGHDGHYVRTSPRQPALARHDVRTDLASRRSLIKVHTAHQRLAKDNGCRTTTWAPDRRSAGAALVKEITAPRREQIFSCNPGIRKVSFPVPWWSYPAR
jgi:AcrR family transcriptional regulator